MLFCCLEGQKKGTKFARWITVVAHAVFFPSRWLRGLGPVKPFFYIIGRKSLYYRPAMGTMGEEVGPYHLA